MVPAGRAFAVERRPATATRSRAEPLVANRVQCRYVADLIWHQPGGLGQSGCLQAHEVVVQGLAPDQPNRAANVWNREPAEPARPNTSCGQRSCRTCPVSLKFGALRAGLGARSAVLGRPTGNIGSFLRKVQAALRPQGLREREPYCGAAASDAVVGLGPTIGARCRLAGIRRADTAPYASVTPSAHRLSHPGRRLFLRLCDLSRRIRLGSLLHLSWIGALGPAWR